MIRKTIKIVLITFAALIFLYFALGYLSSYIGYSRKWEFRTGSISVEESKKRGVFVKELSYRVDSFSGKLTCFRPFIERGFRFGYYSSDVTRPLTDSRFPYQLSFNAPQTNEMTILIRPDQLEKFDSSNAVWGYLRKPELPDTIILEIGGEHIRSGSIKVW